MARKRKPELIPAVGYLRKSTKGKKSNGQEKQEKSIPAQKAEIEKLAEGRYQILEWFTDEGISGWKRGAKRPDFMRMLAQAELLGAQAILCDNLDRFSRANYDAVQEDAMVLKRAGVRWIVTASHGTYDIGANHDIGEILKFVVAVWSAHEYSRTLSRRVSIARRNKANNGKMTGGKPPYGMKHDGRGGLKHGDPKEVKTVRRIFDEFANGKKSMNKIADDLNSDGISAPGGKGRKWYSASVRVVLKREAYRGDFVFNRTRLGRFYITDSSGEIVEATDENRTYNADDAGVMKHSKSWKPLVEPTLFDKAQKRLKSFQYDRGQCKRVGYPLTGVLYCGHCGKPMFGIKPNYGKTNSYRCGTSGRQGSNSCQAYHVREDLLLPYILQAIHAELEELRRPIPDEIARPHKNRQASKSRLQSEYDQLSKRIDDCEYRLLDTDDKRTRKSLDAKISAMRDELEQLEIKLSTEPASKSMTSDELNRLFAWYSEHCIKPAVCVWTKVREGEDRDGPKMGDWPVYVDPWLVNGMLMEMGCKVTLRWKTEQYDTANYKKRNRHILTHGRIQCGILNKNIPKSVLQNTASRTWSRG